MDSGILADEELDALADSLLNSDSVQFLVPASWFDGPVISIPIDEPGEDDEPVDDDEPAQDAPMSVDDDDNLGLSVAVGDPRRVQPPLRRWSAGWLVRRDPDSLAAVRERVRELERRDGAAAMNGMLDAVDRLPPDRGDAMVDECLRWPDKAVRRLALRLLAERGDANEAVRRARHDPDASIRKLAAKLAGTSRPPARERRTAEPALF